MTDAREILKKALEELAKPVTRGGGPARELIAARAIRGALDTMPEGPGSGWIDAGAWTLDVDCDYPSMRAESTVTLETLAHHEIPDGCVNVLIRKPEEDTE